MVFVGQVEVGSSMNVHVEVSVELPSGINGRNEISGGRLPKGRVLMLCGADCGKPLVEDRTLVGALLEHDEPGVFPCFEKNEKEPTAKVTSLGYDCKGVVNRRTKVETETIWPTFARPRRSIKSMTSRLYWRGRTAFREASFDWPTP